MSSAVRWSMGLVGFFCRAVMVAPWLLVVRACRDQVEAVVDVAGAGGGADAGLDQDAVTRRRGGELAVAQVAHRALAQRQHAAEADAHPAAAGHQHPGLLGGVEDRLVAVRLDDGAGLAEGDGAALAGHDDRGAEPLDVQRKVPRGVVVLERLEQAGRPAGVRRALGDVGHDRVQVVDVEHAVGVGVQLDEPQPALRGVPAQLVTEDHLGAGQRGVQQHDVGGEQHGLREQVAQHPDDRGDAGPGGDQQQLSGIGSESTKSPSAWPRWTIWPRRTPPWTRWLETTPPGMPLTVMLMQRSGRGPWVSE